MMRPGTELHAAVLATVAYADLFDFSPTSAEIHRYLMDVAASPHEVQRVLDALVQHGELCHQQRCYTLPGRRELVALRQVRAERAAELWQSAEHYARWIARLPFVRMVAVTGSLAANNPLADADIDYLIVTRDDRLWLCRLFVLGVVRWAARRGIELCPNYFLAERALALAERDVYTARELAQMRPLFGREVYCQMVSANAWVAHFLPNCWSLRGEQAVVEVGGFRPKRWLESGLSGKIGQWLERWEQQRKLKRFATDAAHISEAQFSADRCKGHIGAHGARTRSRFEQAQSPVAPSTVPLASQPLDL